MISFCSVWKMAGPMLQMAAAGITNPALKAAIAGLVTAANSYCGTSLIQSQDRASLARLILDKAASEPLWREQLIQNSKAALASSGLQPLVNAYMASHPQPDCDVSCILITT